MTKRRILAILLSLLLLVQALPTSALAATLYSNTARGASYPTVKFELASSVDENGALVYDTTVEQLVEAGGKAVVPDVPDVDGYEFTGWGDKDVTAAINEDTTFKAQYSPVGYYTVTVKFVFSDGVTEAAEALSYDYEIGTTDSLTVNVPEMTGFNVSVNDESVSIANNQFTVDVDGAADYIVTYTGKETEYTVNHNVQNIIDANYTTTSEKLSGKAGEMTAAVAQDKGDGFTVQEFAQKSIDPNGSTVVDIYYNRNTYNLTYNTDGGTYVDNEILPYEAEVKIPAVEKPGYTFTGWTVTPANTFAEGATSFKMPASDVSMVANWEEATTADYTVLYWVQTLNDKVSQTNGSLANSAKTYDYLGSDTFNGNVGSVPTNFLDSPDDHGLDTTFFKYNGTNSEVSAQIAADGSTVYNVKFDRALCTFTFKESSDRWATLYTKYGLYGQSFSQAGAGSWPTDPSGRWTVSNQGDMNGNWTYLDGFNHTDMDRVNLTFTESGTGGTDKVIQYIETLNSTETNRDWEAANTYTGSISTFNVTGKFEPGFTLYGYKVDGGSMNYTTTNVDGVDVNQKIEVYSTRNSFNIVYKQCDPVDSTPVKYGAVLPTPTFTPTHPDGKDDQYKFGGWFYDPKGEEPVAWNTTGVTMPAADVLVYAYWIPKVQTVTYYLNYEGATPNPYASYNVYNGDTFASHHYSEVDGEPVYSKTTSSYNLPVDPTREGYTFGGWYTDPACTKPLIANFKDRNVQIVKNWTIYAKWTSSDEKTASSSVVTVGGDAIPGYYVGSKWVEIKDKDLPTATGFVGDTVYITAPDIPGYVPVQKIIAYELKEDNNIVEIQYTKLDTWMLTVNYVDAETGDPIADPDGYPNLTATTKAVVYRVIPGGTDEVTGKDYIWQATSYVQTGAKADAEANDNGVLEATVTFKYKKVYEAQYTIQHWVEDAENPGSYILDATETKYGWTGYKATATAKTYPDEKNLEFDADNEGNVETATIQEDVVLKLYYNLKIADYTVKHLQQNVDGNGYTEVEADRETISGTIGDKTAAEANTYTGFTAQPFEQQTIAADGSTVVEIKYNRNSYDYVIHHVEKDNVANKLADDTTGEANFGAVIDVTAAQKTIEGFTYDSDSGDITIAVEGNEATIYYSRNSYKVTYAYTNTAPAGATALPAEATYKYGDSVTVAPAATADGYTFSGWSTGNFTMPANDVEITGSWTIRGDLAYTVNYYWNGTDTKLADSKTVSGQTFDATVTESPIAVEGYTPVSSDSKSIKITTDANVIDFYYYKNVEIIAESGEETYNGAEQSVSGFTGAPEGADFSAITVGAAGTNVDTYPAAFAEGTVGTVDATYKYIITKATDGELVINQMALTITADSDVKEYDGTALTKNSYTNTALATGDAITSVTVTGSQTVVGESENVASAAVIKDGDTEVTGNYAITYKPGTLEVIKSTKSIKVVANSNEWNYDGADHADGGYTVTFGEEKYTVAAGASATLSTGDTVTATITKTVKNVADTAAGNNVIDSLVVSNADQYETIESEAGTLTIKPINATVTIVGNYDTDVYDGTEHKVEDYTATADTTLYDVTKDFTFSGTAVAARTEEGTTNMGLEAKQFTNTNGNFATVTFNVTDGYQTVTPVDEVVVTITGKTSTVDYDGAEHSVSGYDVVISNPLYKETDFTFTGTAAASRTDAGKTTMGLVDTQFANKNANFKTVIFNVTDGYQEILPIDVTVEIVGNNNTTTYDGQPHTVTGYVATASTALYDVENDFTFSGNATATQTDVGTAYMGLKADQFKNDNANFATVTFNVTDGYQTITPLEGVVVTITEKSGEADYDGTEKTVTGYTAKASSTLYDVTKDFIFTGNDSVSGINADTYDMELKPEDFTNTNTNFADVTFVIEDGQLVIKPIDVTVTIVGANNTTEYDGKEHEVSGYTATASTELYDVDKDFSFSGTAVAARTDVGQTDMGLTAEQFENTNTNFATVTFEVTDGYQKITPVEKEVVVTIVGKNNTTDYDGTEHGVSGYDVTNISNDLYTVADFSFSGTAEAKRTDAGQTDMGLTAEQFKNTNANFSKVTFNVTDGYQKINPIDVTVTITGHNNTAVYDGEEHTVTGYDVEIGNSLYKEADFTFTGTASASRTEEGTTYMGLAEDQFANTNGNFATVTFVVTDGYQTITPVDAVVVTIIGNTSTVDYDGEEHTVTDYTATANNELYDVTKDFTFSGTAEAKRTDVGTTYMNLAAEQFKNTNGNFATVTFQVTDGYQKVEPIDVTVTIVGNNSTEEYDGTEHTVTGYVATASTELYDVTKDFTFSGTAEAKRTEVGTTYMGLEAAQFANTNGNFATVTFNVTDGYQTITPMDDLVTVTIVGNNSTVDYDGEAHTVTGYEATVDNELYDVTKDFTFSGTASATRTDAGTTNMELVDTQFANVNENFSNVKFVVTDGYQKINPIDVTVTITGHNNTTVYDGEEHTVTGYDVAISNDLYKEADFTFSGNATASRTEEGTTNMGLIAEQFANTNANFETVTFNVTDGYQTITPVTDEVVVTIVGNNVTKTYDGVEYIASGYAVEISNPLYTEADFTFNGTAEVKRTDVGTTDMGLAAEQFANISDDFANVKFVVTDGYVTINPRPITVIADSDTKVYDATALTDGDYLVLDGAYVEAPADATYDQNGKTIIGTEKITATVSGSQTLVGESANTVATLTIDGTQYAATAEKFGNYAVTFIAGTLVVTEPEDDSLVVNKTHEDKEYALGETVTFTITVKNIYDAVKTITITEKTGVTLVGDTDGDGKLVFENVAAGETVTATATYVITSDDILAGEFVNKVEVSFDGGSNFGDEDPVDPEKLDTTLDVEKTSDKEDKKVELGEVITYTITVTNKGNVPFYNVVVTDELVKEEWKIAELAVGATETLTATYTVTSDDILAGEVVNSVTATAAPVKDPDGEDKVPTDEDDVTDETGDLNTTLEVVKTSDVAEGETVSLGDTITYTITVKNDGNVPFTNVKVTDEWTGDSWTIAELAVGATETYTATHVVTSDDILAGKVVNEVVAEGDPIDDPKNPEEPKTPTDDDEVEDETDDLDTTLTVVKTTTSTPANGETYALNEKITYEITVTNEGNVPFKNVIVTDELTGDEWTIEVLAVGESKTFTAEYVVVEADIKAGSVINEVTAKGDKIDDPKNPDDPKQPEGEDDVEDPTDEPNPAYTIVKVRTDEPANGKFYELGEEVEFEITVTNTGNVTLNGIVVKEELEGALFENGTDEMTIESLPPLTDNVVKFTATYVITEDDLGKDDLANTLSATDSEGNKPDEIEPTPIPVDDATTVTVTKVWDDLDNKYNTRTAITVNLLANGEAYGEPAVIAEDENGEWNTATFEKLPVHKNGEPIVYTVEEDAVAGYDATYANEENSWTITNTLQQYTLTIRHWIHFVGGEVAAPNYERSVYYGETYNVRSANVIGFWPNPRYTTGVVTGDMVHDVIYDELDFTLTVQYVYQNGATAAPTHVEKKLHYGDDYRVVSPKLEGYVASSPEISGYMGTRDLFFTVIYVPENTVIINEYGVPLGIGNVEMNVGDCFE